MSFARSESQRAFGCVGMGMGADLGAQALDSGARVWVRARGCAGGCRFGHAGMSVHGCGCGLGRAGAQRTVDLFCTV